MRRIELGIVPPELPELRVPGIAGPWRKRARAFPTRHPGENRDLQEKGSKRVSPTSRLPPG